MFHLVTPKKILRREKGPVRVPFPPDCGKHLSEASKKLITGLLQWRPSDRLGMIKGGSSRIKYHEWFGGKDIEWWNKLQNKTLKPPYLPQNKAFEAPRRISKSKRAPNIPFHSEGEDPFRDFC